MPEYMCLLYATDADEAERAERWAEMPLWDEVNASLREAGVRGDETELTDGPFAVTKEVLAGYYVIDCADLDQAVAYASRLPLARYGSVEVRPIVPEEEIPRPDRSAGAS